ncbi:MAG: hypothetical protein QGG71_21185, partial [Pirellulaceae bacterium]|nr:hypothetical protein [Pirellulaceae bacterium]
MAKSRRVIRRIKPAGDAAFDEQFWPVILAVFVLGGFLMGTVLAYLDFEDPRWYAKAWIWMFAIPIVLCILIALLRKVESRAVHRGVQFSSVLCIIVHLVLLLIFIETNIFARFFEQSNQVADLRDEQLIEPEYQEIQLEPERRPQQDVNRPVETETPDPTIEELSREQVEEQPVANPEPQPTPETVPTVDPNAVKRPTPAKTTPRQSKQTSQLSRQMAEAQPRPAEPVATPQMNQRTESQPSELTANDTALTRQPSQQQANRRVVSPRQETTNTRNETQMTRRVAEVSPQTEATPSPTMRRTQTPPRNVPRTAVSATQTPSTSRQTEASAIRPNTIATRQQPTASPSTNRAIREPTSEPRVDVQRAQQRQQPSESQPTLAQTPRSVPNPRPRVTTRPEVNTMAAAAGATSQPNQQPATVESQSTSVQRSTAQMAVERRETEAPSTRPSTEIATTQQRVLRNSQQPTSANSQAATGSIARSSQVTALPNPTTQAEQVTGAVRQNQPSEVSPTSVATRLQATARPQAARAVSEPATAVVRSPDSAIVNVGARRRAESIPSPQALVTSSSALQRQSRSGAQPTTSVAAVAAPASNATNSTAAGSPSATATSVARRSASSPTADMARSAGAVAATEAGSQAATRALRRSSNSDLPAVDAQVAGQTGAPSRSTASRAPSSNLTATNAPRATSEGAGQPSPAASRMAITRSLAGTAGIGQSSNMDRSLAANDSPSLVSSGSARRAQATQNTPEGAALSPMAPALARSSMAGADRPQASLLATDHVATSRGSDTPTEVNASASSALARADSNASPAQATAAAGNIDVDTGPTRVVDEGGVSRASGGGQPELNQESMSQQVARSRAGASAAPALATNVAAQTPSPVAGSDGGRPAAQDVEPSLTVASRGEAGGAAPAAGSPTAAASEVAAGTSQADDLVSAPSVARAGGAARDAPEQIAAMAGGEEDEEEKAKRLARSAVGGAPQLAVSAPVVSPQVGSAGGQPGSSGEPNAGAIAEAASTAGAVSRSSPAAAPASSIAVTAVAAVTTGGGLGGATIGAATMQRAEAAAAKTGQATPGGGTSSPARSVTSRAFAANLPSVEMTVAGVNQSGGSPDGTPIEAQATAPSRSVGGVVARANQAPVGAVDGDVAVAGTAAGPDTTIGLRQRAPSSQAGPAAGGAKLATAPLSRSQAGGMTAGPLTATTAEASKIPMSVARDHGVADVLAMASNIQPMSRQSSGALPVHLGTIEGPGGLGAEPTIDVGVNTRQARRDSTNVQPTGPRFSRSDFGGVPSLSTSAVVAAESFRKRASRMSDDQAGGPAGGFGPQTEEAIERGLAFLVRQQLADGSWSLQSLDKNVALVSDTAATGLAMLAFQGAGYNHREFKYADVVSAGIGFLVANQRPDGDLFVPLDDRSNASVWLYSHGIAAIALCEAYGMTQDPELREPAQKSIDFIVASQHRQRGGWRYSPGAESDTSVSGWMMMALKSGRLAGLSVPDETFVRLETFLSTAQGQGDQAHMFRYNPNAPDTQEQRHGRKTSKTMTSVGLLMRLYAGWSREHQQMMKGADYLRENLPEIGTTREPQRDTYYWYYATQVMFHVGGDHWRDWNNRLHSLLVGSQEMNGPLAGSWDPRNPIPDTWAPHAGRLYVTTLNLLSL